MESEVIDNSLDMLKSQTFGYIHDIKKFIAGKVLTVTDAITPDPSQRKAVKDIIHDAVWAEEYFTGQLEWHFKQFAEAQGWTISDEEEKRARTPGQNNPQNPYKKIN